MVGCPSYEKRMNAKITVRYPTGTSRPQELLARCMSASGLIIMSCGHRTIVFVKKNIVFAKKNIVFAEKNLVFANKNIVVANKNIVFANSNIVFADNDIIFANNNIVLAGTKYSSRTII